MPSSWIKGLVTWLSGLILAVLMLAAGTATSASNNTGQSAGQGAVGDIEPSAELELPGLAVAPSLTERTV